MEEAGICQNLKWFPVSHKHIKVVQNPEDMVFTLIPTITLMIKYMYVHSYLLFLIW